MTGGASRWERWARPRVLVAAVLVVLVMTVALIGLYSVLLDRMSSQVEDAQSRSANLSNADREVLVLLQAVTQFGPGSDPDEIDLHRGVAARQIVVSIASFEPGDPQVRELQDVRTRSGGVPLGPARRDPGATPPCAARRWTSSRGPSGGSTCCAASRRSSSTP